MTRKHDFCGRTRREFIWQAGGGFAGTALAAMLGDDGFLGQQTLAADGVTAFQNPLAPKQPHFTPKAKAVIFLFMYGGPSHIDTFDYKPKMKGMDNKTVDVKTFGRGGHKNQGRIVEPRWDFQQYGECGKWVSDLFPHLATCVDDIAFLHSMTADSPIHGSAMLMMNSGKILSGSPCLGSWINYGLGTVNRTCRVLSSCSTLAAVQSAAPRTGAAATCRPRTRQRSCVPKGSRSWTWSPRRASRGAMQREMLDSLREYNEEHHAVRGDNSNLAARIASYELAFKMQQHAPEAVDLAQEDAEHSRTLRVE